MNGDAPHEDTFYSNWTKAVASEILGRPINAHAFRRGLVTFHRELPGVSQTEMDTLADLMGHDSATAKAYYYVYETKQKAMEIHERMRRAMAASATPAAASAAAGQTFTSVQPSAATAATSATSDLQLLVPLPQPESGTSEPSGVQPGSSDCTSSPVITLGDVDVHAAAATASNAIRSS